MPRVGASSIPEMEMKHDPMAQAYRRTATGLVASKRAQRGRVDDRLHRDPEAGPLEEEREPDRRYDRRGDDDQLAAQHVDPQQVQTLVRQEGVELNGGHAVDGGEGRLQQHQQADGGHDLHRGRRAGQPVGHALQEQGAAEADDEHGAEGGDRPGQAGGDPESVEHVGRRGGLGPDGEIEDARCLEREDQTQGGEGVDGAVGDPRHDVGPERERAARAMAARRAAQSPAATTRVRRDPGSAVRRKAPRTGTGTEFTGGTRRRAGGPRPCGAPGLHSSRRAGRQDAIGRADRSRPSPATNTSVSEMADVAGPGPAEVDTLRTASPAARHRLRLRVRQQGTAPLAEDAPTA